MRWDGGRTPQLDGIFDGNDGEPNWQNPYEAGKVEERPGYYKT
jgi:hypothetical protein